PVFFGANPAEVPSGAQRGRRTLPDEQDLAFALARGVDPGLRGRFVIAAESPGDIVSGPGRVDSLKTPAGIGLGELGAEQRTLALRLIEVYARNMRADIADEELRRMREAGAENVRFAWAGAIDPRQPHYYRMHGPTLLIEYDNSQNRANHIHSVWHDPRNDFGADLLRAHYERGHHHACGRHYSADGRDPDHRHAVRRRGERGRGEPRQQGDDMAIMNVKALTFDVFGTVVDWRSSLIRQGEALGKAKGFSVDWAKFADSWRGLYQPAMDEVRSGRRPWTKLDDLHRESLDKLLV